MDSIENNSDMNNNIMHAVWWTLLSKASHNTVSAYHVWKYLLYNHCPNITSWMGDKSKERWSEDFGDTSVLVNVSSCDPSVIMCFQARCCVCWCLSSPQSTGAPCCRAERPGMASPSPRASSDRSPSWSSSPVSIRAATSQRVCYLVVH